MKVFLIQRDVPCQMLNLTEGIPKDPKSAMESQGALPPPWTPPGISPTKNLTMTLEDLPTSPSHVCSGASFSRTHANDQACFSLMDPERTYSL